MSDHAISLLSISVAVLALIHSYFSAKSSSKQIKEISRSYFDLYNSTNMSSAHADYISLLSDADSQFETATSPMIINSGNVVQCIVKAVGKQGIESERVQYVFMEVIRDFRNAFDPALAVEQGQSLFHKIMGSLGMLESIPDYCEPPMFIKIKSQLSGFLFGYPSYDPNAVLYDSASFRNKVSYLHSAVPESVRSQLFSEVMSYTSMFSTLSEEARPVFTALELQLDRAIRKNQYEEKKIEVNHQLGPTFFKLRSDIDRFKSVSVSDYSNVSSDVGALGLNLVIRTAVILFVISEYPSWGLQHDKHRQRITNYNTA